MSASRFFDGVNTSVDVVNDLLQTYMPLQVGWTIGSTSCTFELAGLTVKFENQGMSVTATSDIIPRKHLDPLRQALRAAVDNALSEPSWSTVGFGVLLLQLGEGALSHVEPLQRRSTVARVATCIQGREDRTRCMGRNF